MASPSSELQNGPVDLVDHQHRLDPFLAPAVSGLSLDGHTFNGVDDDQGAVGDLQAAVTSEEKSAVARGVREGLIRYSW